MVLAGTLTRCVHHLRSGLEAQGNIGAADGLWRESFAKTAKRVLAPHKISHLTIWLFISGEKKLGDA